MQKEFKIYVRNIFGVPIVAPNHGHRVNSILSELTEFGVDVALLQEVLTFSNVGKIKSFSKEHYSFVSRKKSIFTFGGGLCALIKKDILFSARFFNFRKSGLLTDMTVTDKISKKGIEVIHVTHPVNCILINTHMTCSYVSRLDSRPKVKKILESQLEDISAFLKTVHDIPIILCGDFNLEPGQDILKKFIAANNLEDRSKAIAQTYVGNYYQPRFLFYSTTTATKPDYIFTRNIPKNWKVRVDKLEDKTFISDHSALLASVSVGL